MKQYDDIIELPHHKSAVYPEMSTYNRAAQFAPFAALTGYDNLIAEAGRYTEPAQALYEDEYFLMNQRLCWLTEHSHENITVTITIFKLDPVKNGGTITQYTGIFKKIDLKKRNIILRAIEAPSETYSFPLEALLNLESDQFTELCKSE